VSTDEQVAELAAKLREVPWLAQSLGEPWNPNYDALARVAIDHCAEQPAAGGMSVGDLADELREAFYRGRDMAPGLSTRTSWLAVARRARELRPAPPPEPPMPTEGGLQLIIAKALDPDGTNFRHDLIEANPGGYWGDAARAAARALHRTLAPEVGEPSEAAEDELLRLRAELADARGRLADVIQAASVHDDLEARVEWAAGKLSVALSRHEAEVVNAVLIGAKPIPGGGA
jgi:hypothetical protein